MRVGEKERFSSVASLYERYRPSYPQALIDWLVETARLGPGAHIADLGCGTGISSRLLAARGFDVVGIDPNEEMLERARAAGGGPRYLRGEATATGLAGGSMNLVTAAQAFHWFDVAAALREIARILVEGGWAAAFWNVRAATPVMDDYERLLHTFSAEYVRLRDPEETLGELREAVGGAPVREAEFGHSLAMDREAFFGRVHSASYVEHGVDDLAAFDRELAALFDQHAVDGRCEWSHRAIAIAWQP